MRRFYFLATIFSLLLSPTHLLAQEQGLDDKINEAFTPIANWWGGVVLHNFPARKYQP